MTDIKDNVDLSNLNTMRCPSRCDFYCRGDSQQALIDALQWAKSNGVSVLVLGGGSNVILMPEVHALVLQPALKGIALIAESGNERIVRSAAGENWHALVMWTLRSGYYGLENMALIPGSVGAAPIQNIGAYGIELHERFHSLRALNMDTFEVEEFDADRCRFGYRDSFFKGAEGRKYLVLDLCLRLSTVPDLRLDYPALRDQLSALGQSLDSCSPDDVATAVMHLRKTKLPDPATVANAGSFFKNPIVGKDKLASLRERFPELVAYDIDAAHSKLAAAWLIDKAAWKGRELGGIKVHDRQALVLTNPASRPASELLSVADAIRADVQKMFAVELEIEPQILGA